ncbi:MAG: sirohydrochlorin chelatase, partial [Cyanobacteria bacterium J083]
LLETKKLIVESAFLETSTTPLYKKIIDIKHKATKLGIKQINIFPLFLLPGVHVKEDIPQQLQLAQEHLGEEIKLNVLPYLGNQTSLVHHILQAQFTNLPGEGKILLSHGSRRQEAKQATEKIAEKLGALVAYWSKPSSLQDKIQYFINQGLKQIAIVPYFLFPGKIIDTISQEIDHWQKQLSPVELNFGTPLGETPTLASLIVAELLSL